MESKQTKIGFMFMFLLAFALFVSAEVSAIALSYESNDKGISDMKVKINDAFFFDLIKTKEIGTLELKSHKNIYEKRGVEINTLTQEVNPAGIGLIYETNFNEEMINGLTNVKIIDMKTKKEVQRDWRFVYSSEGQWEIPIYKEVCPEIKEIFKEDYKEEEWKSKNCEWVFDYYDYSPRKIWNIYNNNNIPKGKLELGIEIEVKKGDNLDIVLEIGSKSLTKHAQVIEGIAEYIYAGGAGNQSVIKYDKDLNIIAVSPNYGRIISSIAIDDDYVYYSGYKTLIKAYKTNLTTIASSPGYGGNIYSIAIDDDYVYYGGYTTQTVRKAYKNNLATIANSPNYGGGINSIAIDDDYVYYGGDTTNKVRKAYKTNLTTIADSPGYGDAINSIAIDDDYVYYGGDTKTVRKAYKTNLTTIASSPGYGGHIESIAIDEDYVYYGGLTTQTIRKAYKTNLATITNSPGYGGNIYSIAIDEDYVYYGGDTTNKVRKAYKTNLSTITDSPNYGGGINSITLEERIEEVSITLNSPEDNLQSTPSTINFNATITPIEGIAIKNTTLYLNDEEYLDLYDTNETINYSKILTLEDGDYTWNITACWIGVSTTEDCTESDTRTFEIDTTLPNITILSGNGTQPYYYSGINHTVNFTIEDDKLDSGWYSYNGTNTSITPLVSGDNNSIIFSVEEGIYNLTIYANDTFGNVASKEVEWDYLFFEENRSYPNETIDTKQETLSIDITSLYDLTVNLNYSGTIYPTLEQIIASNKIRYYTILNIPNVAVNTNKTISWNIYSNQGNATTTESSLLVKSLNYSFNQPRQLLNITIYDEITGDKLNNTQVEALVTYYLQNPLANKTLYEVHTNNNHTLGTNLEIDSLYTKNKFTYQLAGYQPREYLENLILVDGSITQLTLYLLSNSDGTTQLFSITEATTMEQLADVKIIAYEQVGTEYQYRDATYSDDSGSANLWLNPDKAHRITASKEGCTSKTVSMYPTGVSIQNIELDCGGVIPGPSYNGSEYYTEYNITVSFNPTIKEISYDADNSSTHNKTFSVKYEDQSCNVTGAEFKLIDGDTGLVLNTITSLDCEDTLSLIQNVSGKTGIIAYLLLTKSTGETLTYRIIYRITDISDLAYDGSSISRILQKLTDMDDFGLDQKTKTFIAFIVLFLILGGLSMGGVIKSEGFSMYILVLVYIAGLSYLGWFGLELPTIFSDATIQATVNKYMILFLSSLIIGGIALSKAND